MLIAIFGLFIMLIDPVFKVIKDLLNQVKE
jgi:hypothetical protein